MLAQWSTLRVASTLHLLRRVLAAMLTQMARATDARRQASLRLRLLASSLVQQLCASVFEAWLRAVRCASPAYTAAPAARNALRTSALRRDDALQTLVHEAALSAAKAKLVPWVPAEPQLFREFSSATAQTHAHALQARVSTAQEQAEGAMFMRAENVDVKSSVENVGESQDLGAAGKEGELSRCEEGELSMCEGWSRTSLDDSAVTQHQEDHVDRYPVLSPSSGGGCERQASCRTSLDACLAEASPWQRQKVGEQDQEFLDCDLDVPRSVLPEAHRQESLRTSSLHPLNLQRCNVAQRDDQLRSQEETAPQPQPAMYAVPATPPQRPCLSARSPPSGVSSAASKASTVNRSAAMAHGDGEALNDDGKLLSDLQALMRQCAKDLGAEMHTSPGRAPRTAAPGASSSMPPDQRPCNPSPRASCPSISGTAKVAASGPGATRPSVYVETTAAGWRVVQQLAVDKCWISKAVSHAHAPGAASMEPVVLWLADEASLSALCAQSRGSLCTAATPALAADSSGAWQLVNQIKGLQALTSRSGMLATLRAHQRWGREGGDSSGTANHDKSAMMNPFTRQAQQDYMPQTLSLPEFLQLPASDEFLSHPLIVKYLQPSRATTPCTPQDPLAPLAASDPPQCFTPTTPSPARFSGQSTPERVDARKTCTQLHTQEARGRESKAMRPSASRVFADGAETLAYLTQIAPELMRASLPLSPQQEHAEEAPAAMLQLLIQRYVSNPLLIHGSPLPSLCPYGTCAHAILPLHLAYLPLYRPPRPTTPRPLFCFFSTVSRKELTPVGY